MTDTAIYTYADLDEANKRNGHYSRKALPTYLAEAIGFRNAADENHRKAANEFDDLANDCTQAEHDAAWLKVVDAHEVCLIADDRLEQAYAIYNSLARVPTAREIAPSSPRSPAHDHTVESNHANVPTPTLALYSS
jgi:hypothetical protein